MRRRTAAIYDTDVFTPGSATMQSIENAAVGRA
jgi:hypothetical protein